MLIQDEDGKRKRRTSKNKLDARPLKKKNERTGRNGGKQEENRSYGTQGLKNCYI